MRDKPYEAFSVADITNVIPSLDIYAFTFVLWNIQRIRIKLYYYTLQQNLQGQDGAPHAVLQPWEVCMARTSIFQ